MLDQALLSTQIRHITQLLAQQFKDTTATLKTRRTLDIGSESGHASGTWSKGHGHNPTGYVMALIKELKRRNVFRMAVLYAIAAWLIMQVAEVLNDLANLPDWVGPTILGLLAVGFPIALILSWFYELTPAGISLEKGDDRAKSITRMSGRRLEFIVISLLCAAVILFAFDKWWIGGHRSNL